MPGCARIAVWVRLTSVGAVRNGMCGRVAGVVVDQARGLHGHAGATAGHAGARRSQP